MRVRQHANVKAKHGAVSLFERKANRYRVRYVINERSERARGENGRTEPGVENRDDPWRDERKTLIGVHRLSEPGILADRGRHEEWERANANSCCFTKLTLVPRRERV